MNPNLIFSCRELRGSQLPPLDFELRAGTLILIEGEPGPVRAMLRLIGLRERPEHGSVILSGSDGTDDAALAAFRNRHFAFLFATPCLLPSFTVLENIAMPFLKLSQDQAAEAGQRGRRLLDFVGLIPEFSEVSAGLLSLADQHRVALARALVNEPLALFMEELPVDLDAAEMNGFGRLLGRVAEELGCAVVAPATEAFRPWASAMVHLETGVISPADFR